MSAEQQVARLVRLPLAMGLEVPFRAMCRRLGSSGRRHHNPKARRICEGRDVETQGATAAQLLRQGGATHVTCQLGGLVLLQTGLQEAEAHVETLQSALTQEVTVWSLRRCSEWPNHCCRKRAHAAMQPSTSVR